MFQESLQFFQEAKWRRRAKTLSPDPLVYHQFDVIWHQSVSTDFWSRIHMLWPPIIFERPPCPVYDLSACQRGACTFSLHNFASSMDINTPPPHPNPHPPHQWRDSDKITHDVSCKFNDHASRKLQVQWTLIPPPPQPPPTPWKACKNWCKNTQAS